jgi:hypothetical protein
MRRHLWTLVLGGLLGTFVLSSNAQAWHFKKPACPPPKCEPCASPQCPTPQEPCPPPAPCPPPKKCHFQLFPTHKSCLNFPEHVKPPCIVPPCPAPAPPCPPVVYLSPAPSPQGVAPAPQAPSKQAF